MIAAWYDTTHIFLLGMQAIRCSVCSIVIAVGYMFRYSAMAQKAKKILQEHNAMPLAVIARYACGYSDIKKMDW